MERADVSIGTVRRGSTAGVAPDAATSIIAPIAPRVTVSSSARTGELENRTGREPRMRSRQALRSSRTSQFRIYMRVLRRTVHCIVISCQFENHCDHKVRYSVIVLNVEL